MYRSLLFKLGFVPLVFLLWCWRDSVRHYTYLNCEAAGYDLTFYSAYSLFYIEFTSGASNGLPRHFDFYREKDFDGNTPFRGPVNKIFPSPSFQHELPDIPFEEFSIADSLRAERGEGWGGITIPYWLVFLTYVIAWLGLSRLAMRKRKLGSRASNLTTEPQGKISP